MPIAQIPSQFTDARTIGNVPGVRGSIIGTGAKLFAKYAGQRALRLGRKIFFPGRYTYRGAVSRGIGLSSIYPWLASDEGFDDSPEIPAPFRSTFQQGSRRRRFPRSNRRSNYKRHCCC